MIRKYFVGIDPDVDKIGIATWDCKENNFSQVGTMKFYDVLEYIEVLEAQYNVEVIIDAGWLNKKSNFHLMKGQHIREKVSTNIGANHQVGKLIVEFCKLKKIPYRLHLPVGKVNKEAFQSITKYMGITNQDSRDAAMIVYQMK